MPIDNLVRVVSWLLIQLKHVDIHSKNSLLLKIFFKQENYLKKDGKGYHIQFHSSDIASQIFGGDIHLLHRLSSDIKYSVI